MFRTYSFKYPAKMILEETVDLSPRQVIGFRTEVNEANLCPTFYKASNKNRGS
jgi:hypothetical protein